MKSFSSKIFAFLILAHCTVGFSISIAPAFAHDPSGGYRAGYQRGYQYGYQHGYQDAISGQGYENAAESHGLEAYGPYYEGMHEGEHVGYDSGFRAGSGRHHHHHHDEFFPNFFRGDDGER